jgi:predicted nucleotidyltransferase
MKKVSQEIIEEITRRIVESVQPMKIVLFGSHAWGQPDTDSDLDLFVVVEASDQPTYRLARGIYRSLRGIGVPVDVVVQTNEEVERGQKVITSLARKVMQEGRVLHG